MRDTDELQGNEGKLKSENDDLNAEAATHFANSPLGKLASFVGIELQYLNAVSQTVAVKPAIVEAILGALNFPVSSKKDRQKQFDELENKERTRLLPPVMVVREGNLLAGIPIRLEPDARVHWRIVLEEGAIVAGTAERSNLKLAESGPYLDDNCRLLTIEQLLPCGYHRLEIANVVMPLIVAPQRCWLPSQIEQNERLWGLAVQLYLIRSDNNWGVGDFSDLRKLSSMAARWGADVIGLNPLHALFVDDPTKISPYSPASRLFLNILNIDVTALPEYSASPELQALVESLAFERDLNEARAASLVDYERVLKLKLAALTILFQAFQNNAAPERRTSFNTFVRDANPALQQFSVFQTIRMRQAAADTSSPDWRQWPEELRNADSISIEQFANAHRSEIEFFSWMQWIADIQLAKAASEAKRAGMAIGLYRDLAVGSDAAGFETWSQREVVVSRAHVGAPPDILNTAGQDWGLPPFNPVVLRETGYTAFIDLVRANMRYAGAIRIDHVVGLQHLYWVPEGSPPSEGAYVRYPFEDLTGILALESHRNQCLVIGEDLGTVPRGFRERAANLGILSSKVLYFEQDSETGEFLAPADYPAYSLASVSSHDLATIRGWWNSNDIELREKCQLYTDPSEGSRQRERREQEKQSLLSALHRERLDPGDGTDSDRLCVAVHTFLGRSHAGIAMLSMEDLVGTTMQVNLPGSTTQYPNWQRRIPLSLEMIMSDDSIEAFIQSITNARGQGKIKR